MKFTSIPEALRSFREPLLYAFDTEQEPHDVEVKIIDADSDTLVAVKRLYGVSEAEIDIAPYLRNALQPTLPAVEQCGVVELGQQMRVKVEVEGVESQVRRFIAAKADLERPWQLLTSQHLSRTMSRDEFDIISYFAYPEMVVEVVVESIGKSSERRSIIPPSGGQRAVAVTARGWGEEPDELRVTLKVDGHDEAVIHYELKPNLMGARRLAWLNGSMAPEFYTFPLRKSVLIKAARKSMESVWGREAAQPEAENELKLISAYEPKAQIEALCGILLSPRVWLVEGCVPQQVELLTDRIMSAPCGEMGMVEVDLRAAEEGVKLW